jgi:hypothetical protein
VKRLNESDFNDAADAIGCHVAVIKAVTFIESRGDGFNKDGSVKILYEPFQFGRITKHRHNGISAKINNINYPLSLRGSWSIKAAMYGPAHIQHQKRQTALLYNKEASYLACSWGLFQIMAFNYKLCGYGNVYDFIKAMEQSEGKQLMAFVKFIINSGLDDELRDERIVEFAQKYNGPKYKENQYDTKLISKIEEFKKEFHTKIEKINYIKESEIPEARGLEKL